GGRGRAWARSASRHGSPETPEISPRGSRKRKVVPVDRLRRCRPREHSPDQSSSWRRSAGARTLSRTIFHSNGIASDDPETRRRASRCSDRGHLKSSFPGSEARDKDSGKGAVVDFIFLFFWC